MTTEHVIRGTDDQRPRLSERQRCLRIAFLYLFVGVLITAMLYPVLCSFPKDRTGDGSEYYAMEMAVGLEHRPYVQTETWNAYERLRESGQIRGMQPADALKAAYQRLTINGGSDFNHFWFYSAAAAVVGQAGQLVGLSHESHAHFMLLHAMLISGLLLLCAYLHGWRGVLGAAAILFASPVLWYGNKVHTELFTVVLSTAALACALKQRWAYAGVLLSIVTTQNISFIAPAFAACGLALLGHAKSRENRLSMPEVTALSFAPLFALLHPIYYFSRFGSFTPQLINGGAQVSDLHVMSSLRYLFDPDLGLLPNWPLGVFILAVGVHGLVFRRFPRPSPTVLIFTLVYVLAAMLAQAATTNVNSGGTFGPARYGLWYICLFYPIVALLRPMEETRGNLWIRRVTWAAIALGAFASARLAWPSKTESYLTPSPAARVLYGYLPWLWSPIEEVFYERNSGLGELPPTLPALVVGPRCRKALYMPGGETSKLNVYPHGACALSSENASHLVAEKFEHRPTSSEYLVINHEDLPKGPVLASGSLIAANGLRSYLSEGWSDDEPSGVWSLGDYSKLRLSVDKPIAAGSTLTLQVNGLWAPKRQSMEVRARVNSGDWQVHTLRASEPQPARLRIALPQLKAGEEVRIEMRYDTPASPAQLGMSPDGRMLGIYLMSIELQPRSN